MNNPHGAPTAIDTVIANKLANAASIKGVSVRSLSETTGVSYQKVRRGLLGERSLTVGEFTNITRALNLKPADLLDAA